MKRYKTLASCCMAVACMAALLAVLTGCSSQQSYTPPEKAATLSSPTIGKDGTLRVGVNTDNQPLAGQPESSSKIVGIDVDVAAALADSFGLKLEIVDVGSDAESALKEGTVDIVMGIDKSDSSTSFWKSDAYLPTAVALFSTPSNTQVPTNTAETKIAAQVSSKSAWAVTNEFDKAAFSTTNDLKSAFAELESGQVQYVAADAIIGTYAAHSAGYDVHIVALMQQAVGYGVGVSDANTDLKQAVSEALATLTSNGTIDVIETKWLGTALDLSSTPLTAGATKSTDANTADTTDEPQDEGEGDNADDNVAPADDGNADAPADDNTGDEVNAGENAVQPEDIAA
ncbi:amino acid ABC transporter substrate-binding protein [Eggerthella sp. NSJ-70]|uniref:Amino acid ABC transporter substrate-binding protein n=1 Tax=Eggerthella hominis TaxID=2763043 RepID=A0ABR7BUY3_9ACTN|nr:transporter substrate-binding domain-containing protein [Eggerthella hominis]MBC5585394.1 amino acid ABC transporter substrate-binding protein [Eggerthella hominis]